MNDSGAPWIDLKDKLAMVTGASSGIGRAIALELSRCGAAVALVARTRERLEQAAAEITGSGGRAFVVVKDLARAEEVQGAAQLVLGEFGRVDILINNAGVTRDNLVMRISEADWDLVLDTNLKSAFLLIKALSRNFLKLPGSRIINIASVVGLIGNAGQANYSASKGGLIALTYALAKELGSRGVLVNAIAPGFIDTSMTEALPDEVRTAAVREIPLGRFGNLQEVAQVAAFLAGPGGSYIHGTVIRVDGGLGI